MTEPVAVLIPFASSKGLFSEPAIARTSASLFAVHRGLSSDDEYMGWVVSHRASGLRVPHLALKNADAALRAADEFEKLPGYADMKMDPENLATPFGFTDAMKRAGGKLVSRLRKEMKDDLSPVEDFFP